MNIQIYGTSKCFDTKKAERYFKERRIKFQRIDLAKFGLSPREFDTVRRAVGLDAMINKNSKAYEASFIAHLAYEADIIEKLMETPALLNTPIVRNGKQVTIGYCPDVWATWE
ncbi:MAG: ArsC family transcriptional regulator [Oscillospiraceae bacterium]|nr:ArsC family transcriptional regulator [Oscillospiraceae bacterium]